MPTLEEFLTEDLGLGSDKSTEKTAAEKTPEDDSIEKLAMEIGLVEGDETPAAPETEKTGQTKEANVSDLFESYSQLFPGDADLVGGTQEKVAEEEKNAEDQIEEEMGKLAYDHFQTYVDKHVEKIAQAVEAELEKEGSGKTHTPAHEMENNEVSEDEGIDTTPKVRDEIKEVHPEGGVGKYKQTHTPMGTLKHAAVLKHMLKAQLESEEE